MKPDTNDVRQPDQSVLEKAPSLAEHIELKHAVETNTQLEREMGLLQAARLYPKAIFWVLILSLHHHGRLRHRPRP